MNPFLVKFICALEINSEANISKLNLSYFSITIYKSFFLQFISWQVMPQILIQINTLFFHDLNKCLLLALIIKVLESL